MKSKNILIGVASIFAILLFIATYSYMYSEAKDIEKSKISVILYGSGMDRWESLKQGIEQATDDYNAEVNYVTMTKEHDLAEQIQLIQREINNGANGIILAANDSKMDLTQIQDLQSKIPLVTVESGISTDEMIPFVSADNYKMGQELAEAINKQENKRVKIAIICDDLQRDSVSERYEGFYDGITQYFDNITIWEREEGEYKPTIFIQRELTEEAVDIVVALDNSTLEALIDAINNLNKKVKVYGIGNSDKAVYYLDKGQIKYLVYQNEFSIGYIGLKKLMGDKEYSANNFSDYVEYRIVNGESLYLPENQNFLFPFVK